MTGPRAAAPHRRPGKRSGLGAGGPCPRGAIHAGLAALAGAALIAAVAAGAAAEPLPPVSEEDLFADPQVVVEDGRVAGHPEPGGEESRPRFAVSGAARGVVEYVLPRGRDGGDGELSSSMLGTFYLDARLPRDAKYLGNVEVSVDAGGGGTDIRFRESFLDLTAGRVVYFRFGKQVLQWGRGWLWNPTDLINVERKSFVEQVTGREGTFGLRIHAPFGTRFNLYGFLDLHGAGSLRETAQAGKFEFVLGRSEAALSLWRKEGLPFVWAADLSTRVGGLDITAEAAASRGDTRETVRERDGVLSVFREEEQWVFRGALGAGRSFDVGEIRDRLGVHLEIYHNGGGARENVFGDDRVYDFEQPVAAPGTQGGGPMLTNGTKRLFMLGQGLYAPNEQGRLYAAFFATLERFLASDLTLLLSYIRNLDDGSGLLGSGLTYRTLHDFTAGIDVYVPVGGGGREYTFTGAAALVQLRAGLAF